MTYGSTNYGCTTGTYTKPGIPSSGSAGKKWFTKPIFSTNYKFYYNVIKNSSVFK